MHNAYTKVTSFVDPDYHATHFKRFIIVGNTNKLDYRMNIENRLSTLLANNGIFAVPSDFLFPPTRELSDSEKVFNMRTNNIDACLMVNFGESGIKQIQIPITGSITTGSSSSSTSGSVSIIGNNIYNNSQTKSQTQSHTSYIGGEILEKPYAEFELKLSDVTNGKTAWIANS